MKKIDMIVNITILASMMIAIQGKLPIWTQIIIIIHTLISCIHLTSLLRKDN